MRSPIRIGLAIFSAWVGWASAQADVRVALIGADLSAAGQAAVELAEAELSARAGLTLLDRVAIGNVLREQNLAAEGFARPDDAIRLGQLLAVDVFIHAEAISGEEALGVAAFETVQGIRLLDRTIAGAEPDALARALAAAADAALAKWQAPAGQAAAIALMGVRNVDLPKNRTGECEALGGLLERRLLGSPDVVVVERKRLESLNRDHELTMSRPEERLLSAPVLLEVDLGQAGSETGLRATAFLSDPKGAEWGRVHAEAPALPALADQLAAEILRAMKKGVAAAPANPVLEAARFFRMARFWKAHGRPDLALAAAEAAFALDPGNPLMNALLVNSLFAAATADLAGARAEALAYAARGVALVPQPSGNASISDSEQQKQFTQLNADNAEFFRGFGKAVVKSREDTPFDEEESVAYAEFCRDWLGQSPFSPSASAAPSGWDLLLFVNNYSPYFPDPESAWRILADQVRRWSRERWVHDPAHIPGALLGWLVAAGDSEKNPLPAGVYPIRADLWDFLAGQDRPLLRWHGRCGRIVDAARADAAGRWAEDEASRKFLADLHAQLLLPDGADGISRDQLYEVAQLAIRRSGRQPGAWSTLRYHRSQQQFVETLALFQTMLKVGDVRGDVIAALRNPLLNPRSLASPEFAARGLRELAAAMDAACAAPPGGFTPEELRELKDFRDWVRERLAPGSTAVAAAPGQRLERIDVPKLPGRFRGHSALVADEDGAYVLSAYADPSRLALQKWFADSRSTVELGTTPLAGPHRDSPVAPRVAGIVDACLADRRVAVAVKDEGVFLFDRTAPDVVCLHETTSLPVTRPLAVAALGRQLYVGTDDGYLVACDLDAGTGEILVASSRKDKKSPFDDGPPARISALLPDPPRHRLVFEVSVTDPEGQLGMAVSEASGIWEYRTDTGEFKQRVVYRHRAQDLRWCEKVADAAFVYADIWGVVLKYDLATDVLDWMSAGPKGATRVFEKQLIRALGLDRPGPDVVSIERRTAAVSPPFLARGEWLWTARPWGRLSMETYEWEALPSYPLSDGTVATPAPDVGMVPAGPGKTLLADRFQLWLLTEENASQEIQ